MLDYACGILDPKGNTIAQAETIPAQLGIVPTAIKYIFREIPLSEWNEGDIIICNDLYFGCTHTLDIVLFSPVIVDGEIITITSTVAHHIDLGGKVPGTEAADAIEIFEEGLRFPPLKLMDRGKPTRDFEVLSSSLTHVPQGDQLFAEMIVEENLLMGPI